MFVALLRKIKWSLYLPFLAYLKSILPFPKKIKKPVCFIVGCGRSGTTILGKLISKHKDVLYLNEPVHYWYAINKKTDYTDIFGRKNGKCFLDENDASKREIKKFNRLFGKKILFSRKKILIEKLPINSFRIRFLLKLNSKAKIIHIIRDGRAVVQSIKKISEDNKYKIFRLPLNLWWGRNNYKWKTLSKEAKNKKYFSAKPDKLETFSDYGAFEWITSIEEVDNMKKIIPKEQFLEIIYEDLIKNPEIIMNKILSFLNLSSYSKYNNIVKQMVYSKERENNKIFLSKDIIKPFKKLQLKLKYPVSSVELNAEIKK
ncbi:MAG: sulfotransferase [Spirochaetia bacterium]|nr:sulfotransferase [Spirochaetia bacterium]